MTAVFVGHDWAEDHHDIHIEDSDGKRLHHGRLDDGLDGVAAFHAIIAQHADTLAGVGQLVVARVDPDRTRIPVLDPAGDRFGAPDRPQVV